MPTLVEEYRRSLKLPEAEELFDLLIYRPVAYAFVRAVHRTPITPNQVTMLSAAAALAAAWSFAGGTHAALLSGALLYAAANILDCADGQLARLQGSGTPLGRLVDGVADYVSSVAVFLGIGAGLSAAGAPQWLAVIGAGVSSALHAMLFDHHQSEFLSIVRSERKFTGAEISKIESELDRTFDSRTKRIVLRAYLAYLRLQSHADAAPEGRPVDPAAYRSANARMIRIWSFLGPTTNRTFLIACALAGRPDVFLWGVLVAGNCWLGLALLLQRRVDRSLSAAGAGAAR